MFWMAAAAAQKAKEAPEEEAPPAGWTGPEIHSVHRWRDNAAMIADVANLGYLDGTCLDVTWGYGTFWKDWSPEFLVACDIRPDRVPPGGFVADFRSLPFLNEAFDVVIYDPPYKLNGEPDPDDRYGTHERRRWQDRILLMEEGLTECLRVAKKRVLCKCADQVVSGHKVWQTDILTNLATYHGWHKEDRFDLLRTPRKQPEGRRQVHSRGNTSTLLVFAS